MAAVSVGLFETKSITASGDDSISFTAAGTVNISGTVANPIMVNLTSIAGVSLLGIINITNAYVTVSGAAGVNGLATYNIGSGGTLDLSSAVGIALGTTIAFTGSNSRLVLGSGINLNLLGAINGFAPGSSIDVSALGTSVSYTDNPGNGTGGTLNLLNSSGTVVQSVPLSTGEYVSGDFRLTADGHGGTLIDFGVQVTGVTATPATADLAAGRTVTFTVTTSAPVTISGGTPSLTLDDGGTATFNAGLSTGSNLVFTYTVAAGQNSPDLTITALSLNGATATVANGVPVYLSGAVTNPAGTLQVDTTAPTITSLSITPGNGALSVGGMATITLTTSEFVTVTGASPTLTLSDGGTATFDSGSSTGTSLVFRHTVLAGQNSADLAVAAINLNGAAIADGAGNAATLTGAVGNPAGVLIVDTIAPTVTAVATTPSNGTLAAGQSVAFIVSTSEAVTVAGGPPKLLLDDGGTADFDASASTSRNLVFRHVIQPGQNSADLAVSSVNLNGATITDVAGNPLTLSGAVTNPAGVLTIDTTAPSVAGVTINPSSATLGVGRVADITVAMSEGVTITGGSPTLTLSDGGTATYVSGSSSSTNLVFRHTILAGQNSPDLSVVGVQTNGATIVDSAGNAANLSGAVTNPTGTLIVDTTSPTVSSVTATPGSATLGVGQIVTLTLNTSESVTVTGGVPALTLNDGGTALYNAAGSTFTSLQFTYTVAAGQNTTDLAVTGVTLNGATIVDMAGNIANLSNAASNPAGVLTIDTTAPLVSSLSALPGTAALSSGQSVVFMVAMNENVTVAGGTPTLSLSDGGLATYNAGLSSGNSLAFRYTVAAGDNSADLSVTSLNLNGAVVADSAGNAANLAGATGNPAGILVIDTTPPSITGVTTNPGSGTVGPGQTVTLTVATTEPVTVSGQPRLTLSDGGTAVYNSNASSSTQLVFTYTVLAGQNSADLSVMSLDLNGGSITDAAGNAADLTGAAFNPAGTLIVDSTPPTVVAVTANSASNDVSVGQVVTFSVATTEPVTVTGGRPTLQLNDGGTAVYNSSTSTPTSLTFDYVVAAGENTTDLAVSGTSLNGAVVTDAAGNVADLSGAVTNPAGILIVDTTAPTITGVTTNPGSGTLGAGQTITINVATSETVIVVGGVPTLTLSDGGTAVFVSGSSTPTNLVFTTTVQPGQNSSDLAVIGVALNGATVADLAGNALALSGAIGNPPGTLIVLTSGTSPTVLGVTTNPGAGTLTAGQDVTFTVSMSGQVSVAGGTPTLLLSDGGIATFVPGSSNGSILVFTHTVQPGQITPDLAVQGISLNGAVIADPQGNMADLTGSVVNPAGILSVDAVPPTVATVSTSPGSGTLGLGQTVTITVTMSESVIVGTGGTPTLTLNDGGVATYVSSASTGNTLVFTQTVLSGLNTADLAVTGVSLNGATVTDAAGNAAVLTGLVTNPAGILAIDTTAPTVSSVTTNPTSGALRAGQTVTIDVATSEFVTVSGGSPTLTLAGGGTATYSGSGSSTNNLLFTYTVMPGQDTPDLAVTAVNLAGAVVADGAGNAVDFSGAVTNPAGTLAIDTVAPVITSVSTIPGSGTLVPGQTVEIDLTVSEAVAIGGSSLSLALSDGGTALYDSTRSTAMKLAFIHTVQPGQSSTDLTVTAVNPNGTTATDQAGNAVNFAGAIANPAGTLVIDGAATRVTSVTTAPASGSIGANVIVTFTVATTTPVTVTGGAPTLSLNDGGVATYDAIASATANALVFVYTVAAGQNTADLAVTGVTLNGATASGTGGIPVDFSNAITNPAGVLQVDTTAPVLTGVVATPGSAAVTAGQIVTITMSLSEAVAVIGGTPTLVLDDGGTAVYDAASSGPATLVFKHTVQAGQNSADLSVSSFSLNGATVADAAGNAADFTGAVINPAGVLIVDTTAPRATSVAFGPSTGSGPVGQTAMIDITTTEPVTISGGVPTLALSNGGIATYDQNASTPTNLVFAYTPLAGQSASGLTVVGVSYNGASIADPAGNALDLSQIAGRVAGTSTVSAPPNLGVYRFFDASTGTHFFTADASEKNALMTPGAGAYRSDYIEETNDFGAVDPNASDPAKVEVYRFFDTTHGTHFFTAGQSEAAGIRDPNSSTYRADLVFEASASFFEHATPQVGDVPVYRFFDATYGTHFYTGNQAEYAALTTPGTASFRTDLISEGVGFYAPAGSYK